MKWYRQHFLGAELLVGLLLAGAAVAWMTYFRGIRHVDCVLSGNRGAIYGTLATIFGSLLGFVLTAASIIVGVWGAERLTILRESKHAKDLWRTFTSSTKWLGMTTIVALAGLVADRDSDPVHAILYATIFVSVIAILRVARCIWALEAVIGILVAPASQTRENP